MSAVTPVTATASSLGTGRLALAMLGLVALVGAAYGGAGELGFVELDDPVYVTANAHVALGLDASTAGWALRSFEAANWHPLTWLSLALNARLFGPGAAGFHWINVGLHATSVIVLFLLLRRLTGAWVPSFAAAALLAVHPVHVESVAWVSARKDVGFLMWGLMATLAYVRLCEQRTAARWAVVALTLAASLMSKPMAVVWPFLWLLVDLWPLGRWRGLANRGGVATAARVLVLEKAFFFAMALGTSVLTVVAQSRGGAVRTLAEVSLPERLGNAAVGVVAYLQKLAWPAGLACFYPHRALAWWQVAGALGVLVAVTGLAVARRRETPWLMVGWLWFVVALVPVIGVVQVGQQAMADRYAYLPALGIYVAVAFGGAQWATTRGRRWTLGVGAAVVVALLVPVTRAQVATWKDGVTLATHALEITGPNPVALRQLAAGRLKQGDVAGTLDAIAAAAELAPADTDLHLQRARILVERGRAGEAVAALERAHLVNGDPALGLALAELLARSGASERGLVVLRETLGRLPADDPRAARLRSTISQFELMARRPAHP